MAQTLFIDGLYYALIIEYDIYAYFITADQILQICQK